MARAMQCRQEGAAPHTTSIQMARAERHALAMCISHVHVPCMCHAVHRRPRACWWAGEEATRGAGSDMRVRVRAGCVHGCVWPSPPAHGPVRVGPSVAGELEAALLMELRVPPPLRRAAERGAAVAVRRGAVPPGLRAGPVLAVRAATSLGDTCIFLRSLSISLSTGYGLGGGSDRVHSGGRLAWATLVAAAH